MFMFMFLLIALFSLLNPVFAIANSTTLPESITFYPLSDAVKHITIIETYDYLTTSDDLIPANFSTFHKPDNFTQYGYYDYMRYHACECIQAQQYPVISDKARPVAEEYYIEIVHVAVPQFLPKVETYKQQHWRNWTTAAVACAVFFAGYYGQQKGKTRFTMGLFLSYIRMVTTIAVIWVYSTITHCLSIPIEFIYFNCTGCGTSFLSLKDIFSWGCAMKRLRSLSIVCKAVIARLFKNNVLPPAVSFDSIPTCIVNSVDFTSDISESVVFSDPLVREIMNKLEWLEFMAGITNFNEFALECTSNVVSDLEFDIESNSICESGLDTMEAGGSDLKIPLEGIPAKISDPEIVSEFVELASSEPIAQDCSFTELQTVFEPIRSVFPDLEFDVEANLICLPDLSFTDTQFTHNKSQKSTQVYGPITPLVIRKVSNGENPESKLVEPILSVESSSDVPLSVCKPSTESTNIPLLETPNATVTYESIKPLVIRKVNNGIQDKTDSKEQESIEDSKHFTPLVVQKVRKNRITRSLSARRSNSDAIQHKQHKHISPKKNRISKNTSKRNKNSRKVRFVSPVLEKTAVFCEGKNKVEIKRTPVFIGRTPSNRLENIAVRESWFSPRRSEFPDYDLIVGWGQQFGFHELHDPELKEMIVMNALNRKRSFPFLKRSLAFAYYFALRMEFFEECHRVSNLEYLRQSLYIDITFLEQFTIEVEMIDLALTSEMVREIASEKSTNGLDWLKHIETIYTLYKTCESIWQSRIMERKQLH